MQQKERIVSAIGELPLICLQISWMLEPAILLGEGIAVICENAENPRRKEMLRSVYDVVTQSDLFSHAVCKPGLFPSYMVSIVEIGKKIDGLDDVMAALAVYYEREDWTWRQIRGAVTYPLVLIFMVAAIFGVLSAEILSAFQQISDGLGEDYPTVSFRAVDMGTVAGRVTVIIMLLVGFSILLALLLAGTQRDHVTFLSVCYRIPLLARTINRIDSAQFISTPSILLSSGYDVLESLDLMSGLPQNPCNLGNVKKATHAVKDGASLSVALRQTELFSGLCYSMVRMGESAGSIERVLSKTVDIDTEEALELMNQKIILIEPVLVGLVSVVIGAPLLSVISPLVGIMTSMIQGGISMNMCRFSSVALLAVLLTVLSIGFTHLERVSYQNISGLLLQKIDRAVINCYAIEGAYPPSFAYLEENYGTHIDGKKYYVDYQIFTSNIKPEIRFVERGHFEEARP